MSSDSGVQIGHHATNVGGLTAGRTGGFALTARVVISVFLIVPAVLAQSDPLDPSNPARERVFTGGRLIAIETAPGGGGGGGGGGGSITVDASGAVEESGDTTSITASLTLTDADALYAFGVCSEYEQPAPVFSSATWNGDGLTELDSEIITDTNGDSRVSLARILAPDAGTHNLVFNWSANCAYGQFLGYIALTGVDQTTPERDVGSANGASASPSITVTSAADDFVLGLIGIWSSGGTCTPGTGETERFEITGTTYNSACGFSEVATGTSTTINPSTSASGEWAIIGVSIIPDGGGGGGGGGGSITVDASGAVEESGDTTSITASLTLTDADVLYAFGVCSEYEQPAPVFSSATERLEVV